MKVQEEFAVVGFDDIFIASLHSVSLTTVRFDREGLAELAIRNLFNQASGKRRQEPPQYVTVPCQLIVRRSCGGSPEGTAARARVRIDTC